MSIIPGMLTLDEVRRRLGVAYTTAAGYVSRGLLPCERQGNMVFVSESAVEKFKKPKSGNPNFVAKKRQKTRKPQSK